MGNPRLAANYAPGDEIHYKTGSPAEHGIADNSTATVLFVDARANNLTVATRGGTEVSYNPALMKKQTGESTVYREEHLDLAVSERIIFTESNRAGHTRSGDFGTVARFADDYAISVRLDNGKSIGLTPDQAQHIDYGYAVQVPPRALVDRVLITGDASQLAEQQEELARLSPHLRNLAVYTSDTRQFAVEKSVPGAEIALSTRGLSSTLDGLPAASTSEAEVLELGIGM